MENVKNLIIGFGKAGKTLAGFLGSRGESVVLVEKDKRMYGGTCINVGCIPSKFLSNKATLRKVSNLDNETYYKEAVTAKKELIAKLNKANYDKVAGVPNVKIIDGIASFVNADVVEVKTDSEVVQIQAERIFINTGLVPVVPKMEGLNLSERIHTSETIMDMETFPESLAIVGSGYIGLEFTSTYSLFGSKVTIFGDNPKFLPRDDEDIAELVKTELETQGAEFKLGVKVKKFVEEADGVNLYFENADGKEEVQKFSAVLVATGRRPDTAELALDKAGVSLGEHGEIKVNDRLETNVPHIYALGDVHGGLQFTYLSLDDFRIIKSVLFNDGKYNLNERKHIPFNVFVIPSLAKVGMNETEAKAAGVSYKLAKLPVMAIPKAKILGNQSGLFKVLIDENTGKILGANLFGVEAHEIINLFTLAMNEGISYESLRDQIYTHPTMAESFNDLLNI
ncbi:pyridine nucleotide-disulfide oxidoreductase [Catonella morbi ATCC 51271]|uniref:Pyridine nucleotide-disulfide oxidoreductase n=1 Tax=Catonella morbi ATCC 51271 TaxID=592026 RepID=V2Y6L3_9FIRM|nr:FAD-dependent oxidoreductase [Catonella morbi]ESL03732.1 pyridine nucleotide-disulfide oxidoreductase [Catonella morbi ATCC 51271]